jgi:hypothetical protein
MDKTFTVEFGPRKITFYPLSLKSIRDLEGDLLKLSDGRSSALGGTESLTAAIKVLTASARRGDQSITAEDVEQVIDLGNITDVMGALLGNSGFQRSTGPTSPRTGGESTLESSQAQAGDGQTSTS